jgi:hypothetical protein
LEPDAANSEPWNVRTEDLLGLLGLHGWELVDRSPQTTMLFEHRRVGDWGAPVSDPVTGSWVFKRPGAAF